MENQEEVQEYQKVNVEILNYLFEFDIKALVSLIETIKEMIVDKKKQAAAGLRARLHQMFLEAGLDAKEVLSDYVGHSKAAKKEGKRAASEGKVAVVKYRNPDDKAQTWSGRGRKPSWYLLAVAEGVSEESMIA